MWLRPRVEPLQRRRETRTARHPTAAASVAAVRAPEGVHRPPPERPPAPLTRLALTRIRGGKQATRTRRTSTTQPEPPWGEMSVGAQYDLALHDRTGKHNAPGGSLTAAALTVQQRNSADIRRLIQPWQAEAMSYYDLVPEVSFAATFMSQMLSKVRMYPARLDPETNEPEEITEGPEVDLMDRIVDRNGGREELQRSYAKLKFLIGETYLTVSPDLDRGEVWECLSPNELRVQPQGIASRFRAPMLSADQYIIGNDEYTVGEYGGVVGPEFREQGPDVILVYRMWRPSPAYSWLADCSMKANRLLLEELVLSSYSVKAQLKSRLNTVGMLVIPEEMSFPSLGNDPDEDPQSDLLLQRLTQAIGTAIGEPGAASAMIPVIAQVAGEFIKDIQHFRFNDSQGDLTEITQRTEMIERFGIGAELPPELFKSSSDINHWGVWFVDEQTWKGYGHPLSLEMASDFCSAYLQPACRGEGIKDWQNIVIGVDASEVINHPNRAADAAALYQARCLSKKVYLEALGYNENDLPPEDELNEQIGVAIRDGSYARYGIPAVRANVETAPGELETAPDTTVVDPATGGKAPPGPPAKTDAEPASGADKPPNQNSGPGGANAGPAVTASASPRQEQLLAACQAAMHRGREMAGARLRSMTGKRGVGCAECQESIAAVPNWDVPHTLGEMQVVELFGPTTATLVDGTGHWLAAHLEGIGVARQWAVDLGALVEQHCAGTLYRETAGELPAGFVRLLSRVHLPREQA